MLTCLPRSLCSWDFFVEGADGGPAYLAMKLMTEQGSVEFGERFEIRKHGPVTGYWTLERSGEPVGDAQKLNPFTRSFDLRVGSDAFGLSAESAFTRAFDLHSGGSVVGAIWPAHAFTRRAFVECAPGVPELAQLFAFWLVVVTWRRTRNDGNVPP